MLRRLFVSAMCVPVDSAGFENYSDECEAHRGLLEGQDY